MRDKKILHLEQLPEIDGIKYEVKTTNALEKFLPSFFNAIIAFGLATPILIIFGPSLYWRLSVILLFGLYETFIFIFQKDRCFGMKIMDTYWRKHYTFRQHLIYNIFYTLSFSTVLFFIWFPLDLLVINLLCIQLPIVLFTGTTLHGYLSGMHTVKVIQKSTT
jgi:hypothetical protein